MKTLHAIDTETHLKQPGLAAPPIVCFSHASAEHPHGRVLTPDDGMELLRELLASDNAVIGGANIVYDLGNAAARDPSMVPLIFKALSADARILDTAILEKLHDNAVSEMEDGRESYSLAALEMKHFGRDRSAEKEDGWRMRYAELDGVPLSEWPPDAIDYPRRDAAGTLQLLQLQIAEDRENLQCITQEVRAAWLLQLASIWGIRTDGAMVSEVVAGIIRHHEASRERFFREGIVRVRPCNKKKGEYERADPLITPEWCTLRLAEIPPDAPWAAARHRDLKKVLNSLAEGRTVRFATDTKLLKTLVSAAYMGEPPRTDGDDVSTSRDTLYESGNEVLEEYADAGANEKLLSAFVNVLEQGTQVPVNAGFDSTKATQRTSYYKPNMQQMPRGGRVRECFVARPGKVFVSCDYSALEMATLAQVCYTMGFGSEMRDAINAGQDLHVKLAARFIGLSYEEGLALYKAGDKSFKDLRKSAKPINFGKGGLMGAPKMCITARKDGVIFCEGAGVTERGQCYTNERVTEYKRRSIPPTCAKCLQIADDLGELWYSEFTGMRAYHKATVAASREAQDYGIPMVSFGTGMKRLNTQANSCSNHYFQNLAAQGAKHAAWLLCNAQYNNPSSVLYNRSRLVIFIHDETLCEVDEEYLHECGAEQARLGILGMKEFVPDVEIKMEPAACRRWFKGAETVFTKEGKLRPWWPDDWAWKPDREQMERDLNS